MPTFPDLNALVSSFPATWGCIEKASFTSVANVAVSHWRGSGRTALGDKPLSLSGAICSRATQGAGQLKPVSGGKGNFCVSLGIFSSQPGTFQLIDRVWHSDSLSLNSNSPQTIGSPALPARAQGGSGLELGFEIWSPPGATAISPTASYTDVAGGNGSGRTASMPAASVPGSSIANRFFPFSLQGSDSGVASVQSCTTGLSTATGEGGLVLYRYLCEVVVATATTGGFMGFAETGLFQIPDDACLSLLEITNAAVTGVVRVFYAVTQKVPS